MLIVKKCFRISSGFNSFSDLTVSASSILLSLKSDQESFDKRFETQERQYNIMMSSLAEEMAAAKTTIEKMKEEQAEQEDSNNEISELFDDIQQKLATLISNSQNYGKLRVRGKPFYFVIHISTLSITSFSMKRAFLRSLIF